MAVKPGYKQTEVGVIPDAWNAQPLGEVLIKGRLGGNYANQDMEAELPLMKMGNLARGCFDLSKVQFIGPGVMPEPLHQLVCGDVLFNTRNTLDLVGKVAIWRDELPVAYYNSNLMRLEFDPEKICSNEYANYVLNTEGTISRLRGLATGTTSVAAIYTRDLLKLQIPVPPLSEQRAIAKALSDVDALLGALERLIVKKRDLKQAAMQQLLTGQTRLPGFDGEWDLRRLGDIARIQRGASPRPIDNPAWFDENSDIGWVRISDVTKSGMYLRETTQRLSPLGVKHSRPVSRGNLIMSICATVGRPIVNEIDVCIHDGFVVFDDLQADKLFIYYMLKWIEPDWSKHGQTGSQMNLNTGLITGTEISIPPLSEQTAIATVLSDMDAELAALEQRLAKTRSLKQGMMQELLTGRTRLV